MMGVGTGNCCMMGVGTETTVCWVWVLRGIILLTTKFYKNNNKIIILIKFPQTQ